MISQKWQKSLYCHHIPIANNKIKDKINWLNNRVKYKKYMDNVIN